jgi:hypothetical protein
MNDVRTTIRELRRDRRSNEATLARRLWNFERVRRRFGGWVARKLFPVDDLCGPTLMWDFSRGCYVEGTANNF